MPINLKRIVYKKRGKNEQFQYGKHANPSSWGEAADILKVHDRVNKPRSKSDFNKNLQDLVNELRKGRK